jgi:hypothetical protein
MYVKSEFTNDEARKKEVDTPLVRQLTGILPDTVDVEQEHH